MARLARELLFIPNLIGYARLVMVVYPVFAAFGPSRLLGYLSLSFLLDLIDGPVARYLNQTSWLGSMLDIICDNAGRTTLWIYAGSQRARRDVWFLAYCVIFLEWACFASTQLMSAKDDGRHWKAAREHDPWLVRQYFRSNFKNPIGTCGILGLFLLPAYLYIGSVPDLLWIPDNIQRVAGWTAWPALGFVLLAGENFYAHAPVLVPSLVIQMWQILFVPPPADHLDS